MRRGGQGVRTIAAEVERGTQCEPPGIDLSVPSPLSAYAERGTGGEDKREVVEVVEVVEVLEGEDVSLRAAAATL
jgi:hypothetical protein